MQVVWTPEALRDLRAQILYLADRNPDAAQRAQITIQAAVALLADFPQRGRPGRIGATRELVILGFPYIAIYRVVEDRVEVLRVLHTSQEWPSRIE